MAVSVILRSALGASLVAGAMCLGALTSVRAEEAKVFSDPSRIASIGGSLTEIVYALGAERKLVARDSTSVYPQQAMALPDVGYMRALSPEGVLSVNPTGLLVIEGSGPKQALDVLKKASVPFVEIPDRHTHQGIIEKVRLVGQALGAESEAEALAAKVDTELTAAEKLTANVNERKRVLFILSAQGGKLMASGSNSAADGIIRLAGAVNAVEGFEGYKILSDEAALAAQPDVVLMMDRGGDHGASADALFANPALATTPAGKAKRLIKMDGAFLLGFGPRTAEAVKELAVELYGNEITN
jgi:iron complex transport system substrate-binding protein